MVSSGLAQTVSDYDAIVQKGKAQLQAGSADLALASAEEAIKQNSERWEGYALAGGALMNFKRYEEAADKLSKAIERAPEAKQTALRDLRRQCLLAESGLSPSPKESAPAAATKQAEIVLWKSIENSTNPADFQSYLDQYPQGAFVVLAQRHLDEAKAKIEQEQQRLKAKAEQDHQKFEATFSVEHFVLPFGVNKKGLLHLSPEGLEYESTVENGFRALCSDVKDLRLTGRYANHPLEMTVSGKRYVFYPGEDKAWQRVGSSDLLSRVATHCGILAEN